MKTRVIRHWANTDWLYTVEVWTQVMPEDQFITFGRLQHQIVPNPVMGSWRWEMHIVPNGGSPGICQFSRDRAMSIASRMANALPQEDADIIAEFGE